MLNTETDRRPRLDSPQTGEIRVIEGPMFSGKTEKLIWYARRYQRAGVPFQIFSHPLDDRYEGESSISSHDGFSFPCKAYSNPFEVYKHVLPETKVILWDEIQFYVDPDNPKRNQQLEQAVVAVVEKLALEGRLVILAGLGLSFRGEGFGPMPALLAHADEVEKLTAVCAICGSMHATRTQRLIGGEPVPYESSLILVGAEEAYQARCSECHEVPNALSLEKLMKGA